MILKVSSKPFHDSSIFGMQNLHSNPFSTEKGILVHHQKCLKELFLSPLPNRSNKLKVLGFAHLKTHNFVWSKGKHFPGGCLLETGNKKVGKEIMRVMTEFVQFPVVVQNSASELQQTLDFLSGLWTAGRVPSPQWSWALPGLITEVVPFFPHLFTESGDGDGILQVWEVSSTLWSQFIPIFTPVNIPCTTQQHQQAETSVCPAWNTFLLKRWICFIRRKELNPPHGSLSSCRPWG